MLDKSNFSVQRMNETWDLSNHAYPAILRKQQKIEQMRLYLRLRNNRCFMFRRSFRRLFK